MGLDGLEILTAVEDEFRIAIPEALVTRFVTVGDLVDHVYSRMKRDQADVCPSQRGFYVVRKELTALLGVPRANIAPDTELDVLLPARDRTRSWDLLGKRLQFEGSDWPSLQRPMWMSLVVFVIVPVVTFVALFGCLAHLVTLFWTVVAMVGGAVFTSRWRRRFPRRMRKVKDLIRFPGTLDDRVWTRDEVFLAIRRIVAQHLVIEPQRVRLDARWIDDLGLS